MTAQVRMAELLDSPRAECGECPLWSDVDGTLLWLDIPRGLIHRYSLTAGALTPVPVGQPIGSLAFRHDGGLVMGLAGSFALADDATTSPTTFAQVRHASAGMHLNDGAADPYGCFWAGSASSSGARPWMGRLYRVDADGRISVELEGVGLSNGIGFSPDGSTMYYVDSRRQSLDAFELDPGSGRLGSRRVVVSIPSERGIPDGLAVDVEGAIWLALYGSGTVVRFTPEGSEDRRVSIAASQATSCAFGGPDLRTLFVTSASEGFRERDFAEEPHAGGLFAVDVDVAGLPAARFAGTSDLLLQATVDQEAV